MIQKKVICIGDMTTHGGMVIQGLSQHKIMGKDIACQGHMVTCPLCQGTYPIIEGVTHMPIMEGFYPAVEGMKTACGAELIASQNVFTLDIP